MTWSQSCLKILCGILLYANQGGKKWSCDYVDWLVPAQSKIILWSCICRIWSCFNLFQSPSTNGSYLGDQYLIHSGLISFINEHVECFIWDNLSHLTHRLRLMECHWLAWSRLFLLLSKAAPACLAFSLSEVVFWFEIRSPCFCFLPKKSFELNLSGTNSGFWFFFLGHVERKNVHQSSWENFVFFESLSLSRVHFHFWGKFSPNPPICAILKSVSRF